MDNLYIYEQVRKTPENALKTIQGGKLKGKSDINPMWRIKVLTEVFGPCGIGWTYEIVRQWTEPGAGGEVAAFCDINLYTKAGDEWGRPIPGTGGSMLISKEKGSLTTNDEAYKMALTDAISVAAKALGVAADVYWSNDPTKYSTTPKEPAPNSPSPPPIHCEVCGSEIKGYKQGDRKIYPNEFAAATKKETGKSLCLKCYKALGENHAEA